MEVTHLYVCTISLRELSETPIGRLSRSCWHCKQFTFPLTRNQRPSEVECSCWSLFVLVGFYLFVGLKQGLTMQPWLSWSLHKPGWPQSYRDLSCLRFLNVEIKIVCHHICWYKLVIPALKGQKWADLWGLPTSQLRLLGEFQATERLFHKQANIKTRWMIPKEQHLRPPFGLHIHIRTYMHTNIYLHRHEHTCIQAYTVHRRNPSDLSTELALPQFILRTAQHLIVLIRYVYPTISRVNGEVFSSVVELEIMNILACIFFYHWSCTCRVPVI